MQAELVKKTQEKTVGAEETSHDTARVVNHGPATRAISSEHPTRNVTGIPDRLKAGIETLSGVSMDRARVHYNSMLPARLNALAVARNREIHLGPGQEKHLPHEAWHLVQQSRGEVSPNGRVNAEALNNAPALEHDADRFGGAAALLHSAQAEAAQGGGSAMEAMAPLEAPTQPVAQLTVSQGLFGRWFSDVPGVAHRNFPTKEAAEQAEAAHAAMPPPLAPVVAPSKKRGRQTHLDARADVKRGKPTLRVQELHDREFGEDVSSSSSTRKGFTTGYRQPQIGYFDGGGGAGLDERVSTATTADFRPDIESHFGADKVDEAVGSLSEARDHVENLLWTEPDVDGQPLNAHPGGLSKAQDDMRRGITSGHSTRDADRAEWVQHEFSHGLNAGEQLPDILRKTKLMANLKTTQVMSQPFAQLKTVDPTGAIDAYHPRFGALISDEEIQEPAFRNATGTSHNNREFTKVQTAAGLVDAGYGNLVDPAMLELLAEHDNDPDAAHRARYDEQDASMEDDGPPVTQTRFPATPKSLSEMSAANTVTPGLHRTISSQRLFVKAKRRSGTS